MSNKKGFTLIELLVAITIAAIIATVGLTSYTKAQEKSRDARRKNDIRSLQTALELYYQRNSAYPANISSATLTTTYINKVPTDPKTGSAYFYSSSATSYKLCARLENADDTQRQTDTDCTDSFIVTFP